MNNTPLLMFVAFIVITLGITYWAARRSSGTTAFFAANRQITSWQNGWAVAGDYMSAASFLGIAASSPSMVMTVLCTPSASL